MKKLMIALAVAACTVAVQAASFNWSSSGTNAGKTFYAADGATTLYAASGATTLYLFDAGITSQDTLLAGLRGDKTIADFSAVATQSLADTSRLTDQTVSYGSAGTAYNFYMAIVDGDDVFLSASVSASGQASDTAPIKFSGIKTATQTAFADTTATFAANGAGWYAVPEPTSGLLMLLGMAGLALKRKRA